MGPENNTKAFQQSFPSSVCDQSKFDLMHAAPSNTLYGLLHRVASKQDSREGRFEELPGLPTEEPTEQANHRRGLPPTSSISVVNRDLSAMERNI